MLGIVGTTLLIMSISNSPRKNTTSSPGTFETKSVHSWINSLWGIRCVAKNPDPIIIEKIGFDDNYVENDYKRHYNQIFFCRSQS